MFYDSCFDKCTNKMLVKLNYRDLCYEVSNNSKKDLEIMCIWIHIDVMVCPICLFVSIFFNLKDPSFLPSIPPPVEIDFSGN